MNWELAKKMCLDGMDYYTAAVAEGENCRMQLIYVSQLMIRFQWGERTEQLYNEIMRIGGGKNDNS